MLIRRFPLFMVLLVLGGAGPVAATTVVPPEFSELVNGSDYVVRARVIAITHEVRTTGSQPTPYTKVELEVREVISGTPPSPLVLTLLGGPLNGSELVISGAPRFAVGDEDILFIAGNGRSIFPLYGLMHGRYPILKEASTGREYVARANGQPLTDPAEIALPLADGAMAAVARRVVGAQDALSPLEFATRVKSTRKPTSAK